MPTAESPGGFLRFARSDIKYAILLGCMLVVLAGLVAQQTGIVPQQETLIATTSSGDELVLVFIGSSTCAASRTRGLDVALKTLQQRAKERADREGRTFVTVGVAPQLSARGGVRYLERMGEFSEIVAGGSWLNSGAVRYMWHDHPGELATPQVVLLERSFDIQREAGVLQVKPADERVLLRRVGADAIASLAEEGLSLLEGY